MRSTWPIMPGLVAILYWPGLWAISGKYFYFAPLMNTSLGSGVQFNYYTNHIDNILISVTFNNSTGIFELQERLRREGVHYAWISPIQMKRNLRKELTKTFMMKYNCKITIWYIGLYKIIQLFNPYSAGTDFSRQNLTSIDVRFWRLKSMYEKLLTKTFMVISNWKKLSGLHGLN